jgi:hypothetical protein
MLQSCVKDSFSEMIRNVIGCGKYMCITFSELYTVFSLSTAFTLPFTLLSSHGCMESTTIILGHTTSVHQISEKSVAHSTSIFCTTLFAGSQSPQS